MTISKQACRLLHKAEELLAQPWAWTKGQLKQETERGPGGYAYCALGALEEARRQSHGSRAAVKEASLALAETIKGAPVNYAPTGPIISFNDADKTKKKDVLAKFRETRERVGC